MAAVRDEKEAGVGKEGKIMNTKNPRAIAEVLTPFLLMVVVFTYFSVFSRCISERADTRKDGHSRSD